MAKIFVEAYGCSASFADSEMISGLIVNGGHTLATNSTESDLNLIVTCSVKDTTANKMMYRIKSLKTKPLIVAGCLPKAEKENVEKFSENASLLGPSSLGKTLEVIRLLTWASAPIVTFKPDGILGCIKIPAQPL